MPRVGSDEITITDISDGDPAPRLASRRLFKTLTSVPQTPQATITWATNALSNIETGWSETSPTQQAASATVVYFSDLLFSDTTGLKTDLQLLAAKVARQQGSPPLCECTSAILSFVKLTHLTAVRPTSPHTYALSSTDAYWALIIIGQFCLIT